MSPPPLFLLVVVAALVGGTDAAFFNVIPIASELQTICGLYATPTATFTCNSFVNGTGYFNCLNQPYNCFCQAVAPPEYQRSFEPPCKYNYGVYPCSGGEERLFQYCGPHALSCTERCNIYGNCFQVNECTCEPGYEMPTNPQYCSYQFQADSCLTKTIYANGRETAECGIFASQAYFLCPTNVTYDPTLCKTVCNCKPGTGQTPGSSVGCDGLDRYCNIRDVELACGSTNVYTNCTKRCQYTNSAPTVMSKCVVVPGSCVQRNAIDAGPQQRICPLSEVTARCGPATASCTQWVNNGVVINTTCICTATGFPTPYLQCEQWVAYVAAPFQTCVSTCGPGFINGSTYPCQYRRFFTPVPSAINYPGPSTDSTQTKQLWWLQTGSGGVVAWSPQAMTFIDNMAQVRLMSSSRNVSTPVYTLQCTCDTTAMHLAADRVEDAEEIYPYENYGSILTQRGYGYWDPYGFGFIQFIPERQAVNPYRLDFSSVSRSNITIYPGSFAAPVDSFYSILSCRGPSVATNLKAAYNTILPSVYDPTVGYGQRIFTSLNQVSPSNYYLEVQDQPDHWYGVYCQPISGDLNAFSRPSTPGNGVPIATVRTDPYGVRTITWLVSFLNAEVAPGRPQINTLLCNNFISNDGTMDSIFNLGRQGIILPFVDPNAAAPYVEYPYASLDRLSPLDGSGYCGYPIKGRIDHQWPPNYTTDQKVAEMTGLNAVPEYARATIGSDLSVFQIVSRSALSSSIPANIQANTVGGSYDYWAYGPIQLNQLSNATCLCNTGWGGPACKTNVACCPCRPSDGNCLDTCPFGSQPCALSNFAPSIGPLSTVVFRYDAYYNPTTFLNPQNCMPVIATTPTANSPNCDPTAYSLAAKSMCMHGTPNYAVPGVVSCDCDPGWAKYSICNNNQNDPRCAVGCNRAGQAPSGLSNCPVAFSDPLCNVPELFRFGPLPQSCECGGHGRIMANGECECDIGWRKTPQGCCSLPNECPTCPTVGSHMAYCNKTETGGYAPSWVCSSDTSDGRWTGECCDEFEPYTPCVHGEYLPGEIVYNYTNGALVPLIFSNTSAPGVNPNGAVCMCSGGNSRIWTGRSCNESSCPLLNGVPCGGRGNCVNGQCMQGDQCALDINYYGCACQYDMTTSCRGGSLSNDICSGPVNGLCLATLTEQESTAISCSCLNGRNGSYCQISPCGSTNCNQGEAAGQCVRNATDPTKYYCDCYTRSQLPCNTLQDSCLWGGPTCEIDITKSCGVIDGFFAETCNRHGSCNITGPGGNGTCQCTDGWTTSENRCISEPCPVPCGPNGQCVQGQSGPECVCGPHWFTVDPQAPCNYTDCIYGKPDPDLPGAPCVCNNPAYSYSSQCQLLQCPSSGGVVCGQMNCALMPDCQTPEGTCTVGCTTSVPSLQATCTNGTCTSCPWPTERNLFTGLCESKCAPWPATKNIISSNPLNPTFVACECNDGSLYAPQPSGCREKTCLNGGEWVAPTPSSAGACACVPGFYGTRCELDYCNGHGLFDNVTAGAYGCDCFFPYTGSQCAGNVCEPRGFPAENPQTAPAGKCACLFAYEGVTCQLSRCGLHGEPAVDGSSCVCEPGYTGLFCEFYQCVPPNQAINGTCVCDDQFTGPACTYPRCGFSGSYYNGTCHCGGVSALQNNSGVLNCTGNSCGPYGLPDPTVWTCFCNARSTFYPFLTANRSVNCVPNCANGGVYNNTPPYTCSCPPGTFGPYCDLLPISSSSSSTGGVRSSSSSTGTHGLSSSSTASHANTSSSTGHHISSAHSAARTNHSLVYLLLYFLVSALFRE